MMLDIAVQKEKRTGNTHINYPFNQSKHSGDGSSDEWHKVEQASFADEDVEEFLVNANELSEVVVRLFCCVKSLLVLQPSLST